MSTDVFSSFSDNLDTKIEKIKKLIITTDQNKSLSRNLLKTFNREQNFDRFFNMIEDTNLIIINEKNNIDSLIQKLKDYKKLVIDLEKENDKFTKIINNTKLNLGLFGKIKNNNNLEQLVTKSRMNPKNKSNLTDEEWQEIINDSSFIYNTTGNPTQIVEEENNEEDKKYSKGGKHRKTQKKHKKYN